MNRRLRVPRSPRLTVTLLEDRCVPSRFGGSAEPMPSEPEPVDPSDSQTFGSPSAPETNNRESNSPSWSTPEPEPTTSPASPTSVDSGRNNDPPPVPPSPVPPEPQPAPEVRDRSPRTDPAPTPVDPAPEPDERRREMRPAPVPTPPVRNHTTDAPRLQEESATEPIPREQVRNRVPPAERRAESAELAPSNERLTAALPLGDGQTTARAESAVTLVPPPLQANSTTLATEEPAPENGRSFSFMPTSVSPDTAPNANMPPETLPAEAESIPLEVVPSLAEEAAPPEPQPAGLLFGAIPLDGIAEELGDLFAGLQQLSEEAVETSNKLGAAPWLAAVAVGLTAYELSRRRMWRRRVDRVSPTLEIGIS